MTDVKTPRKATVCRQHWGTYKPGTSGGPEGAWDRRSLAVSAAANPRDSLILDFGPPELRGTVV